MSHSTHSWWNFLASQPLPLQEFSWMCYQCQLGLGTDLVKLSLGYRCPSKQQLFLMDGF